MTMVVVIVVVMIVVCVVGVCGGVAGLLSFWLDEDLSLNFLGLCVCVLSFHVLLFYGNDSE